MNNKTIAISVIIPVYNAEQSIVRAMQSVVRQKGNFHFKIIVINDGSSDRSAELIQEFIQNNPEAEIYFIEQKNKGVSAARNAGLKMANTEFIAFLDSDDEWLPNKTEEQIPYFFREDFRVDFLTSCSNSQRVPFPYRVDPKTKLAKVSIKKLLVKHLIQTPTCIMRNKILDEVGMFDERQKFAEDANYWLRIAENHEMYLLDKSLVITGLGKHPFGESGLSAQLNEMEKGFQKNLKEIYQSKKINTIEYFVFFLLSKIKYFSRPLRYWWHKNAQ